MILHIVCTNYVYYVTSVYYMYKHLDGSSTWVLWGFLLFWPFLCFTLSIRQLIHLQSPLTSLPPRPSLPLLPLHLDGGRGIKFLRGPLDDIGPLPEPLDVAFGGSLDDLLVLDNGQLPGTTVVQGI